MGSGILIYVPSPLTRDQGLDRVAKTTRYLAVGSLAVGGVLTVMVSKALPGKAPVPHALSSATQSVSTSAGDAAGGGSVSSGATSASGATNLAPAVQAPAPSSARAPVSSGGS